MATQQSLNALTLLGAISLSCGGAGEIGAQGPQGPQGAMGAMGAEGKQGPAGPALSACPEDYTQDTSAAGIILCKKGADEIVRVGTGRTAFWIDRYEASVWDNRDASNKQYGISDDTYPNLAKNGIGFGALFALSVRDVVPSRNLTWFQAHTVCRESGKRLATRDEWIVAAQNISDPGASSGVGGVCVTQSTGPRNTGGGSKCRSRWGAEDMVGNVWEWTDEWYASVGQVDVVNQSWPQSTADYGTDSTHNITNKAYPSESGAPIAGLPSSALRGGHWGDGAGAGMFALAATRAPSSWDPTIGFRCVIPR